MKILTSLTFLFCCFLINAADASCFDLEEDDSSCTIRTPYVEVLTGVSFPDIKLNRRVHYEPGYSVGFAFGFKYSKNWKIETEVSYQRSEIKKNSSTLGFSKITKGHFRMVTLMANFLYEVDWNFPLMPYFGTGIGYGQAKGMYKSINDGDRFDFFQPYQECVTTYQKCGLAGQAILGMYYKVYDSLKFGIDYRLLMLDDHVLTHKISCNLTKEF